MASLSIFEVDDSSAIEDVITHMISVADSLQKSAKGNIHIAILCSTSCASSIAVFCTWIGPSDVHPDFPEAAAFTRGMNMKLKTSDSGWYRLNCREIRPDIAQKSHEQSLGMLLDGDIVNLARINLAHDKRSPEKEKREKREMSSYCCLALLKSYFAAAATKGLLSYSYYQCLHGLRIVGLGVWQSEEAAAASMADDGTCNASVLFWKSLGAKNILFHTFFVVHATV